METKHLFIRETSFDDCKFFAEWESMPDVTKFFSIDEDRSYEEIVREYMIRELDSSKLQFTIVLKETNLPIGRIYFSRIDTHDDSCDITRIYIADPDLRGKGYGYETMTSLLEYCFINMHMERVTLDYFTGNKPALELYQRLGFKEEGLARNAAKKNGKYYDLHLMSMLRSEYYENRH